MANKITGIVSILKITNLIMKKFTILLIVLVASMAHAGGIPTGTSSNTELSFECVHEHIYIPKSQNGDVVVLDRESYGVIDNFNGECPIYIENDTNNEFFPVDRLDNVIWEGEEFEKGYPYLQQEHPAHNNKKHDASLPTCRFALDPIGI